MGLTLFRIGTLQSQCIIFFHLITAQTDFRYQYLKARLVQLNKAIEKQGILDNLVQKLDKKGLLTPNIEAGVDTSMLARDGARDNYVELNKKLDKALEYVKNRLLTNKAAYAKPKAIDEDQLDELKCWSGYHRVAGTKAGFPGSCAKNKTNESNHSETCPHCGGEMVSEELMNEKKDACYYKVKSRYKVWPSAYASGALVKCRKSGADSWGNSGKKNESIEEGWQDEAQELEDWSKEVNKKLYRAHETQRPGLARQLSKLEQKHFGSSLNQGSLTEIVKAALMALQKGQMVHYDPQQVGQMPFGNIVGDEAKLIAKYNITRDELAGYRMLHDKNMVDNLEQFLKLRRLVRAKSWPLEYYEELEKLTPEEAWLKMADDLNWSKDDMNEEIQSKTDDKLLAYYAQRKAEKQKQQSQPQDQLDEKWTKKYKDSINCSNPKGFSQKAHCAGKQKNESAIMKGLK